LLQGLEHALFPKTDVGQDLGTTTKRWRNLLVQKIAAGITNATKLRIQEVGTSTWITVNADFDGTNWNREDTTQPAQGIEINNNKEVKYYRAAAGTNPITWTNIFTISTDRITASQAVIGTDPGGTEVLRAQNLRAGPTTITGALSTTDTISAPTAVIGTDPGGTEVLRAQNIRAGATTLTATLTAPSAVIGTDPGGTEVLRAQGLRAGGGMFSDIYSNTVVAGTDPGGTESLRAGSARLNAPVLLGSVPQFTMDADPTAALQVATKQYADTKLARNTSETITAQHTFNPSTTGAPFLVGTNASGQLVTGLNADQVDGQHLADLDTRFVNASGDSMSGALVVGDDPGGSEVLRAQSLRAGSGRIGSWRILGVIQPTSNVTSVQFSELDLSPTVVLRLVMVVRNPTATRTTIMLRVNGEANSLDWAFQSLSGEDTGTFAFRAVDASEIAAVSAGMTSTASCTVCVGPSGAVVANSTLSEPTADDTPAVRTYCAMKNTTITSLSSIEIVSSVTNGIASGSVFYLEYLAP
jgi:hypothetical protein